MWKLVFSLLVVVGILELVSPATMTDTVAKNGEAGDTGAEGQEGGSTTGGETSGSGAQNFWLSGGHAVAALLFLVLCLQ
ncbi:hypothetical protein SprV_0602089500 [Sparganum proliferum]